jgi:hypothetical protein
MDILTFHCYQSLKGESLAKFRGMKLGHSSWFSSLSSELVIKKNAHAIAK